MSVDQSVITTGIFRMTKGNFVREMLKLHGTPWVWASACVLLPAMALSIFYDVRWFVVALMIVFLLIPMAFAFFYIYYGFAPVTVLNVLPHAVEFSSSGLWTVIYNGVNPESEDFREIDRIQMAPEQIGAYSIGLTSLIVRHRNASDGFLWIPFSIFSSPSSMAEALKIINKG